MNSGLRRGDIVFTVDSEDDLRAALKLDGTVI